MKLFLPCYLGLGLIAQCAFYSPHPDWTAALTWLHILLWPGFLADDGTNILRESLSSVSWLSIALGALLLAPVPGVWLALRAAQRRQRRAGAAATEQNPPVRRIEPRLMEAPLSGAHGRP